jgi:acetyl esterase
MAIDRWTADFFKQLESLGAKPSHLSSPGEVRETCRAVMETNGPGPVMARVSDHLVRSADGAEVALRVLVPVPRPRAVVVYYHGGGWVAGSIDDTEAIARKLADRTSCAFVLVGYRLAPENPYPAAVEDAYSGLEWVSANVTEIAGRDVPLMVAGDDAGANLAAVVALRARDRGGPVLAMQILACPMLDPEDDPSFDDNEVNQLWVDSETMRWRWDQYLPDATSRSEPEASPLRATTLEGLPPAVVVIPDLSPSSAGAEVYAQRLRDAGVAVNAVRYRDQVHGFFTLLVLREGERAFQQVIRGLRACLAHLSRA